MATQRTPLATPCLLLLVVALTVHLASSCNNCLKNFKSFFCSFNASQDSYSLQIKDFNTTRKNAVLHLECNHAATRIDLKYHKGCNFSSVQYVILRKCPLSNASFSEMFAGLGILSEKVLGLKFDNLGVRKNLKFEKLHLEGLENLEILDLEKTMLTTIPPEFLQSTPKLQHFLFSQNNMQTLPQSLFAGLNLKSIHLINNKFESLPDNLFINASSLTNLTLFGNSLGNLSQKLLSSIPNVEKLELSHNKIKNLTSETFFNLPRLKKLLLKFNDLEFLPDDIFHNCSELEVVNLRNNRLQSLPATLFSRSRNIKDFRFNVNEITDIPQELLQGLKNLTVLSMSSNALEKLPLGAFGDLTNLEELTLHNNPLKTLLPGTFNNQQKLKTLILRNASLSHLPDNIFKTCKSLQKIDLSHNHLKELKNSFFPHPVTVLRALDLGSNDLSFSTIIPKNTESTEIQVEQFPLSDQIGLTDLTLYSNRIRAIPHALRNLQNLRQLDLRNNSIEHLDYYDFSLRPFPANLQTSNASRVDPIQAPRISVPRKVVDVKLKDNPLICDCNLYNFSLLLQESIPEVEENQMWLRVIDSAGVTCSPPNNASEHQLVESLNVSTLFCYRKHCHPSCSCAIRPHDHMFIMDCASQGLQAIPKLKPYLPKGHYSITLSVKNNSIANLEGLQSPAYSTLVNLTVSNNHLKAINKSHLPATLQVLDVSNNALTNFGPSLIAFLNGTNASLHLSGNPWVCDCHLADFYNFLRDPRRKLADPQTIMCSNLNKPLLTLGEEKLCPTLQQPAVVVAIASTTILIFIFFVLGTVTVYKYQHNIKVWLFSHKMCLWLVAKDEADAYKKYDAFISYSNKDEAYVNKVLVPGLECGEPRYRVCLHYRDWVAGEYIQNQMEQSIEDSHRTIVVLSSHFIQNVWGHIEFKTAHAKALKEKANKIIVIVLGKVPPESELDEELKLYLSTRTYLQSDHPKFWENLRYAMPHPQEFLHKKRTKNKKNESLEMG